MGVLANPRHELICQFIVAGFNWKAAAINAGYTPKAAPVAAWQAKKLPEVQARIHELQENISRKNLKHIMSSVERKYRLTEFASANLVDFMDEEGDIKIDKNQVGVGALSEYTTKTRYITKDDKTEKIVDKTIKLRDPIASIDLLNKMDKVYSDTPMVVNNTQIVFVIGKGYTEKDNGNNTLQNVIEDDNDATQS